MSKVYLVNTNKSNNPTNELEMLNNQKAAAYYSPWKYYINEIEANDLIFLYSTNRGIIARGAATGIVEVKDVNGNTGQEHYMNLNRFEKLNVPLAPSEITRIAQSVTDEDYKIFWNQTMIHLPFFVGEKIWQEITRKHL